MSRRVTLGVCSAAVAVCGLLPPTVGMSAQETGSNGPAAIRTIPWGSDVFVPLPSAPQVYQTSDHKIRVVTLIDGLSRPFSLAFLPSGEMLITERTGKLRIIRNGVLDPSPIAGIPTDIVLGLRDGLSDVVLHPNFSQNGFMYMTYTKRGDPKLVAGEECPEGVDPATCARYKANFAGSDPSSAQAVALYRAKWDGKALVDGRDIFVAKNWIPPSQRPSHGSRLAFGKDGMLYMTTGVSTAAGPNAQNPASHQGKILRLRDDGTAPPDNPFVGRAGYLPEIFTMGHRAPLGLAVHPETGAVWELEMGPQGGDEVNILLPGRNYGWPKISMGRDYSGEPFAPHTPDSEYESPIVFWAPAIGPSGLAFYRGGKFPKWKDSIFVGGQALPHLERVVFNAKGQHIRREWLLMDLKQRIRDVREGPDGYLYVLTDASKGALIRIEPAD